MCYGGVAVMIRALVDGGDFRFYGGSVLEAQRLDSSAPGVAPLTKRFRLGEQRSVRESGWLHGLHWVFVKMGPPGFCPPFRPSLPQAVRLGPGESLELEVGGAVATET